MKAEPKKIIKRLYSVEEAAAYLGRSEWSVRRLIWSGVLPQVRIGSRRVQLDIGDLERIVEQNKEELAA